MDKAERKERLEALLTRAGEVLGDITPHVYRRYYQHLPEAREVFDHNHPGGRGMLEGQMVEQVLYCLMEWIDSPGEIEIILISTIPHHIETLGVEANQFTDLVTAVVEVIAQTIPADRPEEAEVWHGIAAEIAEVMAIGASHARPRRFVLA